MKVSRWKRFCKWFKSLFSTKFIVPVVNERLSTAVDDKIKKRRIEFEKLKDENQQILRNYVRTYLDKEYTCEADMAFAYDTINRDWKKHVRLINSTSKVITLRKDGFEKEVKMLIANIKSKAAKQKEVKNG